MFAYKDPMRFPPVSLNGVYSLYQEGFDLVRMQSVAGILMYANLTSSEENVESVQKFMKISAI